jgi:hypothetical protein
MLTFKQFLIEGGAATADVNTVRANKQDIEIALQTVSAATGVSVRELTDNLLGSTPHTLAGLKKDSGDLDIAFEEGKYDRQEVVDAMTKATGYKPKVIGGNTYSYAVDTYDGRKVQVDLMFVPSEKWARWIYHSDPKSQHKGKIRNALLRSVAAHSHTPGKDLVVRDKDGNIVIKVRLSLQNDKGLIRLHKIAPKKKSGVGRTKTLVTATEKDILQALKELGHTGKFTMDKDQKIDPDAVAVELFGPGTKAKDIMSTEQVVEKVLKMPNAAEIVQSAVGNEMTPEEVPIKLRRFLKDQG